MKRSDSTEMERLLRRYARRDGEALRAKTEANIDAHLDADEMNAFAEGALPEAARSRYFAHLADCDDCRTLVTELTLAASHDEEGRARVASLETTPSKSWRERLAVIFSPAVLRYAVPALALFAVIVVAIVAMRTNRKESGVALNVEQSRYSPSETTSTANSAAETNTTTGTAGKYSNSNAAPLNEAQSPALPGAAATPTPAQPATTADNAPVLSKTEVTKSETAQQPSDTKDTVGEFGIFTRRGQQEVAAAPAQTPPPPKETDLSVAAEREADNRDKREDERKNKAAGKDDNDEMVVGGSVTGGVSAKQRVANESRPVGGRTTTARAAQNEQRKRPAAAAKSGAAATDAIEEKESSTETQSVGGRRFRRQGGAWVDTAYNSGPTTNVARGSEQYRALVADEPTLRTITQQLGGVVIVVWKRRAYRFY